ncbi:G-protein coupled receptor GRL101 [Biomphalaria glabrata]
MFSTILLICLCYVTDFSDTHRPMPLKDCQSRSKDVLFIIDCRSEVKEQIEVVQSAIFYLSKDRDDKNISHSFMSFSVTGLIQTNNLTEIQNVQPMCNKKLPINDIFNASALWFTSRKKPLVTISFISDTTEPPLSDDVKAIVQIQKKEKKVDRLFIIPDRDGDSKRVFHKVKFLYYYALSHDLNRNIVDIFARICKKMCKKLPATFTSGHFMTSYYHIADVYNMSYDQSVQYCAKRTNSYLVSLESSQEISFLFDYLNKSFAAKDFHKTDLRIHIGIAKHKESWSSGNPFVYLKNFSSNHGSIVPWSNEECYFLNISSLEHIDLMDKTIESFMKNLISNTCSEIVEPSLVICECHDILSNPSSIHNISNAASSNKNVIFGPYLEDFVGDVQRYSMVYNYRDLQIVECVQNVSTGNNFFQLYVCSKKLNLNFNARESETKIISVSRLNGAKYVVFEHFDISDCMNYSKFKHNATIDMLHELSFNKEIDLFCDRRDKESQTSGKIFSMSNTKCGTKSFECDNSTEIFQCERQKTQVFHRCIKEYFHICEDNSHLQNCETFVCPKGFIKCPNSYCIFSSDVDDGYRDCPLGEDEFQMSNFLGFTKISFIFEEFCVEKLFDLTNEERNLFHCDLPCPMNYTCVSNKVYSKGKETEITEYTFQMSSGLYNTSNLVYPPHFYRQMLPFFQMVELYAQDCRIQTFDYSFQYWNLLEVIVLDLSYNELISSNDMKSISSLSHLKVLNISHNQNLTIDQNFVFPTSLEIIDFSYTKTSTLKLNVFENVSFLKHLNLSNTLVSTFQDMGIPEYYKLETLYIENIEMTNISENFFRGLTINSELRASDYKLCCPQILNPNISADKCHAPVDAISSCKHLVGDVLKRITIWTVGLITLVANGIVLVYRIGWNREIFKKAYELFVTGLGVSDFIMGMYLMLIAAVDIQYSDIYVLEDVKWRHSHWCHFAGFLSTLSSETSTFFICLITTDRFLKTTYPHGQHRFTKTGKYVSFTLVWLISFLLAAVPIVSKDWNIYSTNGLCLALPLITTDYDGWVFSFIVFVVLNFALFLFIVMGQILIFTNFNSKRSVHSIKRNSRRRLEDLSVARKLAFVALTDFMCWFPVALLGILSLSGYIFDREVYAWIAVFVLPINSALNPIIYTIPVIYKKFLSSKISF